MMIDLHNLKINTLFVLTHISTFFIKQLTDGEIKTILVGCPAKVPMSFFHRIVTSSNRTQICCLATSQPFLSLIHSDPAPDSDTIISLQVTGPPINLSDMTLEGQLQVSTQQRQQDRSDRFSSNKDLSN